jgi:hypothetical protein
MRSYGDDGQDGAGGSVEQDLIADGRGWVGGSSDSFYQHKWLGRIDGLEERVGAIKRPGCILLVSGI